MNTPNILMTRIDNRLIHGQVGVTWTSALGANLILVANDNAANDKTQQSLMDMVVADGVQTRYFSLQNYRCDPSSGQFAKIFLVCQTLRMS